MKLPSGKPLEFILAVPARRYGEFVDLLAPVQEQCANAQQEVLVERPWNKLRLVVAHDPHTAREANIQRDALIQKLEEQAAQWVGKLDVQDTGKRVRGRKLSDAPRSTPSSWPPGFDSILGIFGLWPN